MSEIDSTRTVVAKFVSIRRWKAGVEWQPGAHSHPFCEIVVVLGGTERVKIRDSTLYCPPGNIMFYPPYCVHEERQSGDVPLDFICLDFEWPHYPDRMPNLVRDRQGRVQELVRWLLAEDQVQYARRATYQEVGTRLLALELARLAECPEEDTLSEVYDYIQEHLAEPISLSDLAGVSQLNKFHLSRLFRAHTGLTPMEYVRQVRLDRAHRLILETDLPLREIAPRSGVANEYHLSRLLKARYGRGARDLRRARALGADPAE